MQLKFRMPEPAPITVQVEMTANEAAQLGRILCHEVPTKYLNACSGLFDLMDALVTQYGDGEPQEAYLAD